MRKLLLILCVLALSSCAAINEMAETGEPPVRAANIYSGTVKSVMRAALIREPWNFAAGILSAATNGGIDLTVEEPAQ